MNGRFLLLFLVMFLIGTDTFLVSPILPQLCKQFDVGVQAAGWLVGAYAFGYALCALLAGPVSDGLNRKTVLLVGLVGFSVTTFLAGTAPTYPILFTYRLLAGVFAAITAPQVWAMVPSMVPAHKVIRAMGIVTAGLAAAQALGVPLAAYFSENGWALPFLVVGVTSLCVAAIGLMALPGIPPANGFAKMPVFARYAELLGPSVSKRVFLAYFMFQLGNFAAFTFLGTWLASRFALSPGSIGMVMMFLGGGNLVGSLFGTRITRKMGATRVLAVGILLSIALYIALPYVPTVNFAKAGYFCIFLVAGTIFPVMMAVLQGLSTTSRGTIASLSSATMYGATVVGSTVAGWLYHQFGGFSAVAWFTVLTYAVSYFLFAGQSPFRIPSRRRGVRQVPNTGIQ